MDMHRWSLLAVAALLVAGCAAMPQQHNVKEVRICNAADCDAASQKYSVGQLLNGFAQLLKTNEGENVTICSSNPKTRACESVGFCYFVLGGILPGNGCSKSIAFREIAIAGQQGQISLKANMPLTFIWTPVVCDTMTGTFSVDSPDEISLEFRPYYCNWMVVGNMSATFNFAVESIDLSHGQISGYWSHAVKGTGNGRGSGYVVLQFPKAMTGGENWLAGRAQLPLSGSKVLRAAP